MDPRSSSITNVSEPGYRNCVYYVNTSLYDKKFLPSNIPAEDFTHIFYAYFQPNEFGVVSSTDLYADFGKCYPNDTPVSDDIPRFQGCITELNQLKSKHGHLETILSIGGLEETTVSANFAAFSASTAGRANFISSSISLLRTHNFNGLDINWQYPTSTTSAANYTLLLAELRTAMNKHSTSTNQKHLTLSAACPTSMEKYSILDLPNMNHHLDLFTLLTQNHPSPSPTPLTTHQTNIFTNGHTTPHNPLQAISDLLDSDIPPEKILLGIPLHGRGFSHTEGLGQPFSGAPASDENHEEGVRDIKHLPPEGADVRMDVLANAAYSYDKEKKELFSFETEESVGMKAGVILSQGLGGAVFWEASGDRVGEGSLGAVMGRELGVRGEGGLDL